MERTNKSALREKMLLNSNNELAAARGLGESKTLQLMADAQKKGKEIEFYFDTAQNKLDKIKYRFKAVNI